MLHGLNNRFSRSVYRLTGAVRSTQLIRHIISGPSGSFYSCLNKVWHQYKLAKSEMNVNWCTSCKVVLANEEVVNGVCERCGGEVVHKVKSQWMLKITEYAQRLIDDLEDVDYIDRVKVSQKNWIGRSTGAEVNFKTTAGDTLTVYTTRPDTLFGATYMVISPEHPMIREKADLIKNMDEITAYQEAAAKKSDFERSEIAKDKTGVEIQGIRAINPVNEKEIPIFISDYVLMSYGTVRLWRFRHTIPATMTLRKRLICRSSKLLQAVILKKKRSLIVQPV